jgi:hypothetical protein
MLIPGIKTARNGFFKVPLKGGWVVYGCGSQIADEIRRARDDELSLYEALNQVCEIMLSLLRAIPDHDLMSDCAHEALLG